MANIQGIRPAEAARQGCAFLGGNIGLQGDHGINGLQPLLLAGTKFGAGGGSSVAVQTLVAQALQTVAVISAASQHDGKKIKW